MATINNLNNALPSGISVSGGTANINAASVSQTTNIGNTVGSSPLALAFGNGNFSLASATGNIIASLSTGETTKPNQPAYNARNSTTDASQTGIAGTVATVQFDNEAFDVGSHFASNTFTASTDGKYRLATNVVYANIVAGSAAFINIVTSNRSYICGYGKPSVRQNSSHSTYGSQAVLADMDNGDTATCTLEVSGEATNRISIFGTGVGATIFNGFLSC